MPLRSASYVFRTLSLAAETTAYADAVEAGSGVRPTDLDPVDDLIRYLLQIGRYNNAALFLGKSAQNAGTGAVWYNAGGWGGNHALSGGPTWTVNGLDFDGVNDLGAATLSGLRNSTDLYVFTRHRPDNASAPDAAAAPRWSWQNAAAGSFQPWLASSSGTGALSGETWALVYGTTQRLGSDAFSWTAAEDFTEIIHLSTGGTDVWKDDAAITLNLSSGMTTSTDTSPSSLATPNDVFRAAVLYTANNFANPLYWSGVKVAELILDCSSSALSSAQRTAIRSLMAAL